jgi:hypothetical protein
LRKKKARIERGEEKDETQGHREKRRIIKKRN